MNAPQSLWALSRPTWDLEVVRAVRCREAEVVVLSIYLHALFADGFDGWACARRAEAA